ncbi:uncharacterized protein JCM10292_003808 [Rhodotorula paludigena]|uniref:uncharacterized protein n=1 Tax=Rhodotorula paludigena TaxID=86838 RepID=UPI003179DF65
MLARSHGPRLDHNQENPRLHKTPARAGKNAAAAPLAGPAPVTGGKGVLTQMARSGRVLGAKDRNQGKVGVAESAGLLFPDKPVASTSQAQAGPSCAPRQQPPHQQFKTPLPNKTLRPLQDMCTPATGVRARHAPPLVLGSPDVSMEEDVKEQQPEPEIEEDREVEYAGPSARDYDEPYIPDHPEPDYTTAGYGKALRATPLVPMDDPADWLLQDEAERGLFRAEMEDSLQLSQYDEFDAPGPLFPTPKRRAPLAAKPANGASSTPSTIARTRMTAVVSSAASASARTGTPLSSAAARRPLLSSTSAASAPLRRAPLGSTSTLGASARGNRPPSSTLTASTLSLSAARAPLSGGKGTQTGSRASSTREHLAPVSAAPAPRARPPPLTLSRPTSSTSLRSASGSATGATLSPAQASAKRKADAEAAERELGIFGVVDSADDLEVMEGMGALGFGDEEPGEFRLDLEL